MGDAVKGRSLPQLSVIIPACNEEAWIGACLGAIAASQGVTGEVIVVANGCTDDTVDRARGQAAILTEAGFGLRVIETPAQGKPEALNTGDLEARHGIRVYLDADVIISPPLLAQIARALADPAPRLASGKAVLAPARSRVTRAYARLWTRLPFFTQLCPAFGLYAVNAAGRARWGRFPPIISDDTFARLQFTPRERVQVEASYVWPMVEGFGALVRVRRRQDQGVAEIDRLYPDLRNNDDRRRPDRQFLMAQLRADPLAFLVYGAVTLAVRLSRGRQSGWDRGR